MSTVVPGTSRLVTTERDAQLAHGVLDRLDGPEGFLSVGDDRSEAMALPPETGRLLQDVLEAVASGRSVTVTSLPEELTTSTAAAVLGVSRPTLMRMVNDGQLASHKVGSHTRLMAADVYQERRARRARERAAFEALLELEGDEN